MISTLLLPIDRFLARRLPGYCLLCHQPSDDQRQLCRWCEAALPSAEPACQHCGLPLPAGDSCASCLKQPPAWDTLLSLGDYTAPWSELITALKFHRRWPCAYLLASQLAKRITAQQASLPELLLPVPLTPRRWAGRGFNQAELLAGHLGRQLDIAVNSRLLVKTRTTLPQSGLNRQQRLRNLHGAFTLRGKPAARHVAIVDDVVTSGTTAGILATLLRQASVAEISVWCICRTKLE